MVASENILFIVSTLLTTQDDKSALKLTIAKYYTPSGRCIQRDYTDKKEYKKGPNDIENYDNNDNEVFTTKNGRIVHGGGGIAPDILLEKSDNPFIYKNMGDVHFQLGNKKEAIKNYSLAFGFVQAKGGFIAKESVALYHSIMTSLNSIGLNIETSK